MHKQRMTRALAAGVLTVGLIVGVSGSSSAVPLTLPPGTVVTCTQISGVITLRPGIGLTGTSSGVKWAMKAVANNCSSTPNSAGVVTANIVAGIVNGSGYFVGGNTCAAALAAANYGASTMKVNWVAAPTLAPTLYSTVPTGGFNAATTLDSVGITHDRNNAGPTPVSLQLGGDWTVASTAQYATDCSGAAPTMRSLFFQTPAGLSPHNPAFVATI